ncbi:MAG: DNA-3-methyladenine glycosylase [Rhodothermales bacterium]
MEEAMHVLPAAFFARSPLDVAPDLLGKLLIREVKGQQLIGRLVETEAYTQDDEAFIGWGIYDVATGLIKPEGRGYEFFGHPGRAYIYKVYRVHWLLNVITEPEGRGSAVLIRALEPLNGLNAMYERREVAKRDRDLCNGPGKLTQALGIDVALHKHPVDQPPLWLAEDGYVPERIATSTRIGLSRGIDKPWRFFIEGHPHVSPGVPSDLARARRQRRKNA